MNSTSNSKNKKSSYVLYLSMFVMGACGLAYQYTLSKLSSDLLGNSIQQWAVIIGVMMFFMGVGSDLQKYIGKKGLLDKFIFAEILLAIFGAISPIAILYTYGSFPFYFGLVQYFFVGAIGLLIGFEIPLLARINESYVSDLRFNIGGILKMDYIGSLAGALVWIFVLPKFFSITEMAFVLGAFSIVAAIIALVYFRKLVERPLILTGVIISSICFLSYGFSNAKEWTIHAEQKLYKDQVIFSETSPYQRIVLTKSKAQDISLYINGHLQFNSFDEHIYHENLVHPAMKIAPRKERVLILGGGDGMAAREVLKYKEVKELVLVDLDPMVTELGRTNKYFKRLNQNSLVDSRLTVIKNNAMIDESGDYEFVVRSRTSSHGQEYAPQGRLKILNIDAVAFLEQVPGFYDVVIIDFPDPNSPELAKLYSKRFYRLLRRRLAPGGLIIQQSTSPFFAKEAYLAIGRTIKAAGFAAIPYHDTVPSFGEWGWWIAGKTGTYTSDIIKKNLSNIKKLNVETKYLTPGLIRGSLEFGVGSLKTKNTDITTTSSNRVYSYYSEGWKRNFQ